MSAHAEPVLTSLEHPTHALRATLRSQLGEILDRFDAGAEALGERDFAARAPGVGQAAPGFALPDARGGIARLDDLLSRGRVVLVFYRGAWCPYCNLQLNAFRNAIADFDRAGASVVAISPLTPDNSLSFAEREALRFPVLSDRGNAVARAYGLVYALDADGRALLQSVGIDVTEANGDESGELPAPAVFVVERDGRVSFVSIAADYRWRVGPEEVLAVLDGGQ